MFPDVSPSTTTLVAGVPTNNRPTVSDSPSFTSKAQIDQTKTSSERREGKKTNALSWHPGQTALPHPTQDVANLMPSSARKCSQHEPCPKPFIKMVPTKKSGQHNTVPENDSPRAKSSPSTSSLDAPINLPCPAPKNIAYPPRLSHRAQTARLSIILSQLHDSSRNACLFVSKSWRYASMFCQEVSSRRYADKHANPSIPLGSDNSKEVLFWCSPGHLFLQPPQFSFTARFLAISSVSSTREVATSQRILSHISSRSVRNEPYKQTFMVRSR